MDPKTAEILEKIGIVPATVPLGSVKLFDWKELQSLGARSSACRDWTRNPYNRAALVYSLDHEHKPSVGIALRNLHSGAKKDHKLIAPKNLKPLWHNFAYALPEVYRLGVAVLVEGPKDSRVLASHGIPAMAVLAPIPSADHFRVIYRYARMVIWIGDHDPTNEQTEKRLTRARWETREIGLKFVELVIPAKDPAELAGNQEFLKKIRNRMHEFSVFMTP